MKIRYVSAGYFHVSACTIEGLAFSWGRNDYGQLGVGKKDNMIPKPTRLKILSEKKIIMTYTITIYFIL
jgi:alpha-tubulin suppressor-like RCC1 family protein